MSRAALVFGGGAREHALAARLEAEGWAVGVAPGNAGIARRLRCHAVTLDDVLACVALARNLDVQLAVVGPEAPLIAGLADGLRAAGIPTFGPSAAAAKIEGSKAFAKEVMLQAGVPTARYQTFSDATAARAFARGLSGQVAVKADGIAAGKGVAVCGSIAEADEAISASLEQGLFGSAGQTVVVEERLWGPEVSLFALCHGAEAWALPLSHDYKRLREGDLGPNTGGMGAVAPSPRARSQERLLELAILPVLAELQRRRSPFSGLLYAGVMLTPEGPKVLEYNCRFGDPETQVVLQVLSGSLGEALLGIAQGRVEAQLLRPSGEFAVGVVAAVAGYPEAPRVGDPLEGWEAAEMQAAALFAAGIGARDDLLVTSGGRVATVVGVGPELASARSQAYRAAALLRAPGLQLRGDIGLPDLAP